MRTFLGSGFGKGNNDFDWLWFGFSDDADTRYTQLVLLSPCTISVGTNYSLKNGGLR